MKKLTGKGKDNIKVGNHPLTNMISKSASMTRGEDKCRTLKMHLKLRRAAGQNNSGHIQMDISKYKGNHQSNNYDSQTHKKERPSQT